MANQNSQQAQKTEQVKCPGWPHTFDIDGCEIDKRHHDWLSNRKETTHAESERRRFRQHAKYQQVSFEDEEE